MEKTLLKILVAVLAGILTVVLTMLGVVPFLNKLLKVEVKQEEVVATTPAPTLESPQEVLVTVYYKMKEDSKKISSIYIEVFSVGSSTVSYFEVPADTKVNLSEELYKSLQTYAPELPQYLKLSNMAESFSEGYGLTGCNRILSEVLGISLTEYVRADAEAMADWLEFPTEERTATEWFEAYSEWLAESSSSLTTEERWTYYESWQQVNDMAWETAPGSQEKDGFVISGKRSKERLQELMLQTDKTIEQE